LLQKGGKGSASKTRHPMAKRGRGDPAFADFFFTHYKNPLGTALILQSRKPSFVPNGWHFQSPTQDLKTLHFNHTSMMKKLMAALLLLLSLQFGYAQNTDKDAALTSIGSLGAVALYNTYLSIGLMADAHASQVYDADYTHTLIDEQIGMMQSMKENLKELMASGFLTSEDDKAFASDMIACAGLLQDEAQAFKKYLSDLTEESANAYDTARLYAWDNIARLLDLD
jgi:hypothetical protein